MATTKLWTQVPGLPRVLAQSAVAAPLTGSTTETTLATITVPAGALGPNGALRIKTFWALTNSANVKTVRVRLGGLASPANMFLAYTTTAQAVQETTIANRNSEASQYALSYGNRNSDAILTYSAPLTGAIDTTVAQSLVITGQLASAAETITLEAYSVELVTV